LENQEARPFVEAYLKPRPPLVFAKEVAQKGLANAAIDISDGLVQDLGHIARLSNLRAFLELESIPMEGLEPMSCMLGIEASELALAGGEDYGLILSVPAHSLNEVQRLGKRLNVVVHEVGRFERGEQGVYACKEGRAPSRLKREVTNISKMKARILELLEQVRNGAIQPEAALEQLKFCPSRISALPGLIPTGS